MRSELLEGRWLCVTRGVDGLLACPCRCVSGEPKSKPKARVSWFMEKIEWWMDDVRHGGGLVARMQTVSVQASRPTSACIDLP